MSDIVNLRQFRKQKQRLDKDRQAEQNRLQYGRSKAEKALTGALNDKAEKLLDQGRLERFEEKCETVFRPEMRKNKDVERKPPKK